MGILSKDEARAEARYLPEALELVARLWSTHSARDIARAIQVQCRFKATVRLVYALKARLDTTARNRPQ